MVLPGYTGDYQGLLEITRVYWRLPEFTGYYQGILEITRVYWRLPGFTGDYQGLPEITRIYWRLLGFTGDYRRLTALSAKNTVKILTSTDLVVFRTCIMDSADFMHARPTPVTDHHNTQEEYTGSTTSLVYRAQVQRLQLESRCAYRCTYGTIVHQSSH